MISNKKTYSNLDKLMNCSCICVCARTYKLKKILDFTLDILSVQKPVLTELFLNVL